MQRELGPGGPDAPWPTRPAAPHRRRGDVAGLLGRPPPCGPLHRRRRPALRHLGGLADLAGRLGTGSDELERLRLLADPSSCRRPRGKPEQLGRAQARGGRAAGPGRGAPGRPGDRVFSDALEHVLAAVRDLTLERGRRPRRRAGRLEFHDLLVQARDLLRHRPDVARAVGEQYRYLLIDEFQDTDPIQAELAVRIAAARRDGPGWTGTGGRWRSSPGSCSSSATPSSPSTGSAGPTSPSSSRSRQRSAGSTLALTENFRSVPGDRGWVNSALRRRDGRRGAGGQPAYRPLAAPDRPPHGDPSSAAGGGARAAEALDRRPGRRGPRRRRGRDRPVHPGGSRPKAGRSVEDGPAGGPAQDITVLVRTRTGLPILQRALDGGRHPLPARGTSLVYGSPRCATS